jgi:hypothetical protein
MKLDHPFRQDLSHAFPYPIGAPAPARRGPGPAARGARQSPPLARRADRRTVHEHGRDRPARALQRTRGAHHPQPRLPRARRRQGSRRGPPTVRIEHVKLLGAAHPVGGTAADRKLMLLARSVRSEGLAVRFRVFGPLRGIRRPSRDLATGLERYLVSARRRESVLARHSLSPKRRFPRESGIPFGDGFVGLLASRRGS